MCSLKLLDNDVSAQYCLIGRLVCKYSSNQNNSCEFRVKAGNAGVVVIMQLLAAKLVL